MISLQQLTVDLVFLSYSIVHGAIWQGREKVEKNTKTFFLILHRLIAFRLILYFCLIFFLL